MTQSTREGPNPLFHLGHPQHIPLYEMPETASKPLSKLRIVIVFLIAAAVACLAGYFEHAGEAATTPDVAVYWVLPFVLMLGAIAVMPFIARHFWEHNYPWVALALGGFVAGYYLLGLQAPRSLAKTLAEYISFIYLLGSLFIVSGGILIRVRRTATPMVNVVLLLVGALLANVVGTTGASMLLIRPFLRINRGHIRAYHVVFFIFIVSNLGGALTPVGDPPLFLGYLKGVPFWWVAQHCWPAWAFAIGVLLALFFAFDWYHHRGEQRTRQDEDDFGPAASVYGGGNIVFIALILLAVFQKPPYREILMAFAACGSLWTTSRRIHGENVFNYAPVREVALLFIGIFLTMVPALDYLRTHASDPAFASLLHTPRQYYFASGSLSSVLDNAPTYLTFLETELGQLDKNLKDIAFDVARAKGKDVPDATDKARLVALNPKRYADSKLLQEDWQQLQAAVTALREYHKDKVKAGTLTRGQAEVGFLLGDEKLNFYLVAISLGSVFFGAMTYIGNGPNFMVKSIAEHAGVKCPSFFAYIFVYTVPLLLPILIAVAWIFLPHGS